MNAILMMFVLGASASIATDLVDPQAACEAASKVLKDMRYVEGRTADPGDFSHPKVKARLDSCVQVAKLAAPHGEDVTFASIGIAYNESNFREGVKGSAGELGKMQVIPRLHCKPYEDLNDGKGGCTNPERAGVRAFRLFRAEVVKVNRQDRPLHRRGDACRWDKGRVPTLCRTLRRYNGGKNYATKVAGFIRSIQWSFNRQGALAQAAMP